MILTDYNDVSQMPLVIWELRWILYFTVITILQFLVYQFLWKNNKVLKIGALLMSITIVVAPLRIIDFQKLS